MITFSKHSTPGATPEKLRDVPEQLKQLDLMVGYQVMQGLSEVTEKSERNEGISDGSFLLSKLYELHSRFPS